jgi:ribonuclease HI
VAVTTPGQLLLAIAEYESLEMTCEVLGIEREAAVRLLKGAATKLAQEKTPSAAPVRAAPAASAGPSTAGRAIVYSDGAARGNPGPAGAGSVITDGRGAVLARLGRFLGRQTNNVAEYQGLLLGLRHAQELGVREVLVRADSQLMIRQLAGQYAVKNPGLKPLHAEALRLLRSFDNYKLEHIPREQNALADEMSNRAIDEEM